MPSRPELDRITRTRVVYTVPGIDAVRVRREIPYGPSGGDALTLDVYFPAEVKPGRLTPAVVFATGYSDAGARRMLGCTLNEMQSYVSWAELMAASGLVAVTYKNVEPVADLRAVLQHLRQHAIAFGIDEKRVGIWACSGNVPNALSLMMGDVRQDLSCAALCYGYTIDLDGSTRIADAARQFGFANPCAGRTMDDLARDIPLLIGRAGRDEMPELNASLDPFIAGAIRNNLPLTVVNHPEAPHAFDLFHDSERSREIIRQILAFMRFNLFSV